MSALLLFFLFAAALRADVKLPTLLADHMVIQRGVPVHFWGKADPGEPVTVSFRGETRTVEPDSLGVWQVHLPPGEAGGPFEVHVRGANAIVLRDVLVGDVWIAAGQSNMEWPVHWAADPETEAAAARYPRIRLFRAMHRVSEYAYDDLWGKQWAGCSPETVADFSAVGYHFGRLIQEKIGVPVGLIQIAWGGTPIDSWTRHGAIAANASLIPVFNEWSRMMENHPAALLRYQREARDWEAAAARAKAAGAAPPGPPPVKPAGPEGPWKPGAIYNAMIAPVIPFPIRGVIWYQGESNTSAERAPYYSALFRTMIQDWRRAWGIGDFPFLFVQLSNYVAPESRWPELREAQADALALADTAMVVTIDIGEPDNIHPKNKREVGRRLSLAARAVAYGEKMEHSGPLFRQSTREGGALRLWFDHASGLTARGGVLKGFQVAGADRNFVPASARIEGSEVVVSSAMAPVPTYARYAWSDNPDGNLYNAAGLPASPFRSR